MTTPEEVYNTWKNAENLPTYKQDPLDFNLSPPLFPTVESSLALEEMQSSETAFSLEEDEQEKQPSSVLLVPLTKNPTDPVPTGNKMVPVRVPSEVSTEVFRTILSSSFQTYLETGRLDESAIAKIAGQHVSVVRRVLHTEEFGYALACRGVDTKGVGTLTPQQDVALMILTDTGSTKSWGGRLKEAGISQAIFMAWMKNPTFARRFEGISESITANHGVALVELARKVGQGDFQSIKYQLALSGRFNEAQQAQVDVLVMINRVLEILSRHLASNPDVLQATAKDLRMLAEEVSQSRIFEIGAS